MAIIQRMRREGIQVQFDIYHETKGVSVITVILPAWYQGMSEEERCKPLNRLKLRLLVRASILLLGFDFRDIEIAYIGPGYEEYEGKTVHFRGMVLKSKDVGADFFVPGRMAMTCCADDTSFIGYVCKCASAKSLVMGSWVDVTATVKWGYMKVYDGEGPVLYAKEIKPAKKPESELVYFN